MIEPIAAEGHAQARPKNSSGVPSMSNGERTSWNWPQAALAMRLARFVYDRVAAPARFGARGNARALLEVNEHLLRDIGLTRMQVRAAAEGLTSLPKEPSRDSARKPSMSVQSRAVGQYVLVREAVTAGQKTRNLLWLPAAESAASPLRSVPGIQLGSDWRLWVLCDRDPVETWVVGRVVLRSPLFQT
jgi:hypothetical protein